jgi:hypothetical protein
MIKVDIRLFVILHINNGLLPLPSRHLTLEQDVDLTEGSFFHLWNPDVRHGSADKGGPSPDVAALATKVPLVRVEHVAAEEDARNIDQVVGTSSNTGGQWPETNGRCLADDDP